MSDVFESGSFFLPSEIKNDVAARLKEPSNVKSIELNVKGEGLERSEEFVKILRALKKNGVKISHEFSIKLDFPRAISKQKTISILESMPKPVNGSLKAKIHLNVTQETTA